MDFKEVITYTLPSILPYAHPHRILTILGLMTFHEITFVNQNVFLR